MGSTSNAHLIFGIPVFGHLEDDEDGGYKNDPTPFWSVEDEYWQDYDNGLTIYSYGHYEDEDHLGILTFNEFLMLDGDCWHASPMPEDLAALISHASMTRYVEALKEIGQVALMDKARWYLVASYG